LPDVFVQGEGMTAPAKSFLVRAARRSGSRGLVLLAAVVACRAVPQIAGTYELAGVNGRALPVQAGHVPGGTSQLVSGTLTLSPDSTFVYRLRFHIQQADRFYGDSTLQSGTYSRRMATVTFHAPGGNLSGQVAGSAVALSIGGWTYLFRKPAPKGNPPPP
jgi:hypothetical protein